jgi:aryl-alcohol dehydrogenase-like predicted oxidoreductase
VPPSYIYLLSRPTEGSISRLQTTPDLYYLHRIDPSTPFISQSSDAASKCLFPETPLEESIPALDEIRKAGKTKYIGLSECSAATLRKANSSKLFYLSNERCTNPGHPSRQD